MIGRAFFTSLYASTIVSSLCFMMYAMAMVADRDTPAWQCTRTLAPLFRASSETSAHHHHEHGYPGLYTRLVCSVAFGTAILVLYSQT